MVTAAFSVPLCRRIFWLWLPLKTIFSSSTSSKKRKYLNLLDILGRRITFRNILFVQYRLIYWKCCRTITFLNFSPNPTELGTAHWLLSGSLDETIMVWNVDIDPITDCSLSNSAFDAVWTKDPPSDYLLASAGSDNRVQVSLHIFINSSFFSQV